MASNKPIDIYHRFYKPGVPPDQQPDVEHGSQALAGLITDSGDSALLLCDSIRDIFTFGHAVPSALDYAICVFGEATKLLPDTVKNHYGKGPQAGRRQLQWHLVEHSVFFQGDVDPVDVGKETTWDPKADDASNVNFQRNELIEKTHKVLEKMRNLREDRFEHVVSLAIQARCHSLNIARLNRGDFVGDHAATLIDNALDPSAPGSPPWCKADFIACCILLRGCAKSLLETVPSDRKLQDWREGFAAFLISDTEPGGKNKDNDFVVKAHAALVLDNLYSGPKDETSDDLFAVAKWVFR